MDWEGFWGTFIAVIPAATIVTLLVNIVTKWWTKPRPYFAFETQLVQGSYADMKSTPLNIGFVAMTNVGNAPAYHVTIDGDYCDAAVNLPPLMPVTKERVVDRIARIDPGETISVETAVPRQSPRAPALVVKWREHPGRRFLPEIPSMVSVQLHKMPIAAFLPIGMVGVRPLPRLFRRFRRLSLHSARGLEREAQLRLQESSSPDQGAPATPSNAKASGCQGQTMEQ